MSRIFLLSTRICCVNKIYLCVYFTLQINGTGNGVDDESSNSSASLNTKTKVRFSAVFA